MDQNFNHGRCIRCSIKCSNEACTFPKTTELTLRRQGDSGAYCAGAPSDGKTQQVQWGSIPLSHLPVSDGVLKLLTTRATNLGNSVHQGDSCSKPGSRKGQFTSIHVNVETHPPRQSPVGGADGKKHTHCLWIFVARGRVNRVYDTQTWILQS